MKRGKISLLVLLLAIMITITGCAYLDRSGENNVAQEMPEIEAIDENSSYTHPDDVAEYMTNGDGGV